MKKIEELDSEIVNEIIKNCNETYDLEYKEIFNMPKSKDMKKQLVKSILRTVVAFANSNVKVGRLIIGVKDESKEINGVPDNVTVEQISDMINKKINPTPYFKIQEYIIDKKKVIIVDTIESNNRPYMVEGSVYKRMGHSSNVVVNYRELKELEDTVIGKSRKWISTLESSGEVRLAFVLAPIYLYRKSEGSHVENQKKFIDVIKKFDFKMLSINIYIYSTQAYSIELDMENLTIKAITRLKTNLDEVVNIVRDLAGYIYGVHDEKRIIFMSNLCFNSQEEITINERTFHKGINYLIETESETIDQFFPYLINNYISTQSADELIDILLKQIDEK